jgi:prophage maintenance system killer protein
MHYLTVQDIIWIHLQITNQQGKFSFAKLEEATSYQYAYGKSHDVLSQAARFFPGFVAMSPFESGNKAVGFTAGVVFLELNGLKFNPNEKDLVQWNDRAIDRSTSKEAIESGTESVAEGHHMSSRETAQSVLDRYEATIKKLLD